MASLLAMGVWTVFLSFFSDSLMLLFASRGVGEHRKWWRWYCRHGSKRTCENHHHHADYSLSLSLSISLWFLGKAWGEESRFADRFTIPNLKAFESALPPGVSGSGVERMTHFYRAALIGRVWVEAHTHNEKKLPPILALATLHRGIGDLL